MAQIYDEIGIGYRDYRRPDPRFARAIRAALGDAASVVNVGAGAGSYEPDHCRVAAVEPSLEMISQRPRGSAPVVRAAGEHLPFGDGAYDAALAVLTLHHWPDRARGLTELVRVSRERVVILAWDQSVTSKFWLIDYFPQIAESDAQIAPTFDELEDALGPLECIEVPVPWDCSDGFLGAYWRRPHTYLDAGARSAISAFQRIDADAGVKRLQAELENGTWTQRHGHLLEHDELDLGYRLLVARRPT